MRQWITPFAVIAIALLMASRSDAQASSLPDFDGNDVVDFPDFLQFVGKFGTSRGDGKYEAQYDLDGDGAIAFPDFLIFVSKFGKTVPLTVDMLDFPLRSIHAAGHWGTNANIVSEWKIAGGVGTIVPSDFIAWLKSLNVQWVGFSLALLYDDSMDSTIEHRYSTTLNDDNAYTFPDDALGQIIRELRGHGFEVYLTLAFESYEAEMSARPASRWELGNPHTPKKPGYRPENWPWRPDHPDHKRFVAEFWETYTQQAVHFAKNAEDAGARLFSLGTETDHLFRTRTGDPNDVDGSYWINNYGKELKSMVERVRAVYRGLLTYDMHHSVIQDSYYDSGSYYLWEDLGLDVVGISSYFSLMDTVPTTPMSVETAQKKYEEIFNNYLIPVAERNPDRPILFLEHGVMDIVAAPAKPDSVVFPEYVFADLNGNGLDDGRETQANCYQGLINAMANNPGVLDGVFYWDNWMTSDELWSRWWVNHRSFAIKEKLAEEVIRSAYKSYKQGN